MTTNTASQNTKTRNGTEPGGVWYQIHTLAKSSGKLGFAVSQFLDGPKDEAAIAALAAAYEEWRK